MSSPINLVPRPIIYGFEHVVLPRLAFENHPLFCRWLELPDEPSSRDGVINVAAGARVESVSGEKVGPADELQLLRKHVSLERFVLGEYEFFVVTLPPPIAAGEAHAAVIVHRVGEPRLPGFPTQSVQMFTLERADGVERPMLCELLLTGPRRNYGFSPLPDSPGAIAELVQNAIVPQAIALPSQRETSAPESDRRDGADGAVPSWYDAEEFETLTSLLSYLEQEGSRFPARYAYRGQIKRGPLISIGEGEDRADIEPLFPSDARFLQEVLPNRPSTEFISERREAGRDRRDAFACHVIDRARAGDAHLSWIAELFDADEYTTRQLFGLRDESSTDREVGVSTMSRLLTGLILLRSGANELHNKWLYRACWSLAQHYGIATSMLDLTFDPCVAAWFATHPWDPLRKPPSSGQGVVYRFDLVGLKKLLELMNLQHQEEALQRGDPRPPNMFVVSISEIPSTVARRPSSQHGLSLYGFDRLTVIQNAFFAGLVKAFVFSHKSPYESERANRARIQPLDDPFLTTVKTFLESE